MIILCCWKTVYDKLVSKDDTIWCKYNTDKSGLEKKIDDASKKLPNDSGFVKISSKDTWHYCLATTAALNTVENKIPDVSNLVRKTNYDTKIKEIECNTFLTSDYHKFTNQKNDNKIKEKELIKKSKIYGFIGNSDLDKKITYNKRRIKSLKA